MRKENFLKSLLVGTALVSISFYATAEETAVIQPDPDTCPALGYIDLDSGRAYTEKEFNDPAIQARDDVKIQAYLDKFNNENGSLVKWDRKTLSPIDSKDIKGYKSTITDNDIMAEGKTKTGRIISFARDRELTEQIRTELATKKQAKAQAALESILDREVLPTFSEGKDWWNKPNGTFTIDKDSKRLRDSMGATAYDAIITQKHLASVNELIAKAGVKDSARATSSVDDKGVIQYGYEFGGTKYESGSAILRAAVGEDKYNAIMREQRLPGISKAITLAALAGDEIFGSQVVEISRKIEAAKGKDRSMAITELDALIAKHKVVGDSVLSQISYVDGKYSLNGEEFGINYKALIEAAKNASSVQAQIGYLKASAIPSPTAEPSTSAELNVINADLSSTIGDNTPAKASAIPSPTAEPSTSTTLKTVLAVNAEVISSEKGKTAATITDANAKTAFEQDFDARSGLYREHIEGVITLDSATLDKTFEEILSAKDQAANTAVTSAVNKHNDQRTALFATLEDTDLPEKHFTTKKGTIIAEYDTAISDITAAHKNAQTELDSISRLTATTSFNISDKANQTQAQAKLDLLLSDTVKAVETVLQTNLTREQRAEFIKAFKEGFNAQTAPIYSSVGFRKKFTPDMMSLLDTFRDKYSNNAKNRIAYINGIRDLNSHFNKPDIKPADLKPELERFFNEKLPSNETTAAYRQQILEINLDAAQLQATGSSLSSMLSAAMGVVTSN
jgi:hypothetical protein